MLTSIAVQNEELLLLRFKNWRLNSGRPVNIQWFYDIVGVV